jgi:hypothetical protein
MLDQKKLDQFMSSLGYKKLKGKIYKSELSTPDVTHALIFERFGYQNSSLAALFAFRDDVIEPVCYDLFKRFRGAPIPIEEDIRYKFLMRFSFVHLDPRHTPTGPLSIEITRSLPPIWPLNMAGMSDDDVFERIANDVNVKLLPIISQIKDTRALYDRLLADELPCAWFQSNGEIRAIYLLQLGDRIGIPLEQTRSAFEPHKGRIAAGLHRVPNRPLLDPDEYLDRVCEELVKA